MARPTRSAPSTQSQLSAADLKSKKRKREGSVTGEQDDGRPAAKQLRLDPSTNKTDTFDVVYLNPHDAHKILTILETVDTNGFLDRIFNIPSTSTMPAVSLHTLLREPTRYGVDVLRDAVKNLLPISSQPRALLSTAAAEQQRFVELSNDLIDQALMRSTLPDSMDVILQSRDEAAPELDAEERKRQYALVQRLPSGDWWSSGIIPRVGSVGITRAEASALSTKQAELAMVVPSLPIPPSEVPTLGTLKPPVLKGSKDVGKQSTYLTQRKLHAPKLLDYGPYASFAPSYDSENCELGPEQAYQITYESMLRRRARAAKRQLEERIRRNEEAKKVDHLPVTDLINDATMAAEQDAAEDDTMDLTVQAKNMNETAIISSVDFDQHERHFSAHEAIKQLHGIFPADETEALREAFQQLELEIGVSELLHYNAMALQNLMDIQRQRLSAGQELQLDSEEHKIAQEITKSLTLLVSLRPRTNERPDQSLIPPPAILHALHRSLPGSSINGWRGTLASNRPQSLRDDTTVTIKSTARAQAAAQAASVAPIIAPPTPSQPTPTPVSAYPNGMPASSAYGRSGPMPSPMTPGPYIPPYGGYYPPNYSNYYGGYGGYPSPAGTPGVGARPIPDMTKAQQHSMAKGWQNYGGPTPTPTASAIPPHMTGVIRPGIPPAKPSFYR